MTTILVPLDASPAARSALPVAGWLARGLGADVVLLALGEPIETSEQEREEREQERKIFRRAGRHFSGVRVRTRHHTSESPAETIIQTARDEHAGLIVMATHGRVGRTEVAQDEVAAAVVRSGVAPVTLVASEDGR